MQKLGKESEGLECVPFVGDRRERLARVSGGMDEAEARRQKLQALKERAKRARGECARVRARVRCGWPAPVARRACTRLARTRRAWRAGRSR